jgi:hypothetical protein
MVKYYLLCILKLKCTHLHQFDIFLKTFESMWCSFSHTNSGDEDRLKDTNTLLFQNTKFVHDKPRQYFLCHNFENSIL